MLTCLGHGRRPRFCGCFLCSRPTWRVLCVTGAENTRIAESSKTLATPLRSAVWGWSRPLPAPCAPGSRFRRHAFLHVHCTATGSCRATIARTDTRGWSLRAASPYGISRTSVKDTHAPNQKRKLAPSLHARKVGQLYGSAASSTPPADQKRNPKCKVSHLAVRLQTAPRSTLLPRLPAPPCRPPCSDPFSAQFHFDVDVDFNFDLKFELIFRAVASVEVLCHASPCVKAHTAAPELRVSRATAGRDGKLGRPSAWGGV